METSCLYVSDVPSSVPLPSQQEKKKEKEEAMFTFPENLFLVFMRSRLTTFLNQKTKVILLIASESMQGRFNLWVKDKLPDEKLTAEKLRLDTIISSIWQKTKNYLEHPHFSIFEQEGKCSKIAEELSEQLCAQDQMAKGFTKNQAAFLLGVAHSINF